MIHLNIIFNLDHYRQIPFLFGEERRSKGNPFLPSEFWNFKGLGTLWISGIFQDLYLNLSLDAEKSKQDFRLGDIISANDYNFKRVFSKHQQDPCRDRHDKRTSRLDHAGQYIRSECS